jgi:hypothetical protein
MKVIDCVQGTPEWVAARVGVVTASCFDKLLTPTEGKYSAQMAEYENMIVAEILTGESQEEFGGTFHTERGKELEPEAVAYYELERGLDVTHGGFVTNDAGTYGASPDGFAGEEGLIEIKCLGGKGHVGVLLNPDKAIKHRPQIQGQLLVTGRKWVDNLFYHPKLPRLIIRVERDEEYIAKLQTALDTFTENVQKKIKILTGEQNV